MQSAVLRVRGIPMRWEEAGDGPPVAFLHGIPTSPALWRRVIPLVDRARCLAFEMVGYGDSIPAGRDRDLSVGHQVDYLLAWLDAIDIEGAVFVGQTSAAVSGTSPRCGPPTGSRVSSSPTPSGTTPGRSRSSRRSGPARPSSGSCRPDR